MDTMIDTEFKTEFIKMMDEVFKDFDFDIDFNIFKSKRSKKSKKEKR